MMKTKCSKKKTRYLLLLTNHWEECGLTKRDRKVIVTFYLISKLISDFENICMKYFLVDVVLYKFINYIERHIDYAILLFEIHLNSSTWKIQKALLNASTSFVKR